MRKACCLCPASCWNASFDGGRSNDNRALLKVGQRCGEASLGALKIRQSLKRRSDLTRGASVGEASLPEWLGHAPCRKALGALLVLGAPRRQALGALTTQDFLAFGLLTESA
jgi:hypothetical protein